ncbi:recombinase family protein [Ramlibacter sp. MMS24-I3-19]|uniref:recombinase family protein n=1 Tax=Ramlibacter sp. MMS24-I3-19 TaxID=3416606 RepID=UPI003D051A9D
MKQAAIYVRCVRPDASSQEQKSACLQAAALHGFEVSEEHVFTDHGVSGLRVRHRSGLSALRKTLKDESMEAVVLQDLSRLSRDIRQLAGLLREFEEKGVRVIEVGRGECRR